MSSLAWANLVGAGRTLLAEASSRFPSQTAAVKSSLAALHKTVGELSDSATTTTTTTTTTTIKQIPAEIRALKTSVDNLSSTAKSDCR